MNKKFLLQEHNSFVAKKPEGRRVAGISAEWLALGAIRAGLKPSDTENVFECDYAIVHWKIEDIEKAEQIWMNLSTDKLNNCIFILGSSGGREELSQMNHKCIKRVVNGSSFSCYFLIIKNYSPFSQTRCEESAHAMFSMSAEQAESICNSKYEDIPDILKEIFLRPQQIEVLPALCILCQGFLGVWQEVELDEYKLVDSDIDKALELMCWDKVPQTVRDGIHERIVICNSDSKGEQDKTSLIALYQPSWWQVFEGIDKDSLKKQVENELMLCNTTDEGIKNIVLTLVEFIFAERGISRGDLPKLIAKNLIVIHGALKQS